MMVNCSALVSYCDQLLDSHAIADYCPNGLQVEGRPQIARIATGVTASQRCIDAALDWGADLLLVHHGYFWKGEPAPLTGMKGRRIAALQRANVNLLAYHLPLDVHADLGNNAALAENFNAQNISTHNVDGIANLLWQGQLASPQAVSDFARHIHTQLDRPPLVISAGDRPIERLAWCSGGAQDQIVAAAKLGVDAFISGEISERTTHLARELGVHYFAAGHHATEQGGVRRLGAHLAAQFDLAWRHFDDPNPA